MLEYLRSKLRSKKYLNRFFGKTKGSIKDPSICLSWFFWKKKKINPIFIPLILKASIISIFLFGYFYGGNNFSRVDISGFLKQSEAFGQKENILFLNSSEAELPEIVLVEDYFIRAVPPPTFFTPQTLGSLFGDYDFEEEEERISVIEHIIQEGESLSFLSDKYNISLNTIFWANNLTANSKLKLGQKLIILPVSGVIHHVKSGDTVSTIAERYKAKTSELIALNDLSGQADIYIGDIVVVPNGTMPAPVSRQSQQSVQSGQPSIAPLASSQFILPVSTPYIITQGLHWYNAIDFSHQGNACGKPVFAVAGGVVQRTGYHRTAGNYIRVLHPNGVITFYGHLSTIFVASGQNVSQGTRIGLIGNTGYTIGRTGCHLHFEVRGAANPFTR